MHPQTAAWRDAFDEAPVRARRLADGLSHDAFNAAPGPGRWSVGQCLDHLVQTGSPLVGRLEAAVERLRTAGRRAEAPYALGFVGQRFAALNAPGGPKARSPAPFRPEEAPVDPTAVLDAFASLNDRLSAVVAQGDGLALASVRVPSPALRLLRLNVAAWLETTAQHQLRHLAQAEAARTALGGPLP